MSTINFLGFMPIDQIKASGITFDYALPQAWVDMVSAAVKDQITDDHIARHFVYVYPKGNLMGGVMPVDEMGVRILQVYSEV